MNFKDKKALKDEKKDQTAPVVLPDLDEEESDSQSEEGMHNNYGMHDAHSS